MAGSGAVQLVREIPLQIRAGAAARDLRQFGCVGWDLRRSIAWTTRRNLLRPNHAADPLQHADPPQGALRAARSRAGAALCLRSDRLRPRPYRQRPGDRRVRRALPAIARRLRARARDLCPQHHRRRRQDQRRRAQEQRADRGADGADDGGFSRGHGGARRPAARYRAAGDRVHPADDRDDRTADRLRARLCGRRPCAVLGHLRPRLRAALAAQPRRHDRRRSGRGCALQARPGRFRAVEAVRCRICRDGTAPGDAAGRDGTSSARR